MNKKAKHKKIIFGVIASAGLIFIALLVLIAGVYKYNWNNRFVAACEKIIPLPAVYMGKAGIITTGEVGEDVRSVRKFYDSQDFEQIGMRVDFSTDQGKKRLLLKEKEVLDKLIENKIIENLANKRGISISDSDVSTEVQTSINQFGNKQKLMSELARLYGWSLSDFKEKVVKPELYAEKLAEIYASEADPSTQKKKINDLFEKVTQKREDFSKVAREFSEGESAKNAGDLGWSTKNQLIQELADKAYSMKVGETSGIIESPLGFHIVKLEERKAEDGEELVHVRQIFVKKTTFGDWLKEQMKNYRIVVFLRDYQWNKDSARVEFRSEDLRQFEKNIDANSQGDPSVFP
ncbi:MAG: peptidylprolyl isomerase [Patescibacteria group bacterium]|nr:peptidylprolyl isomerase [Patescibacteria group bacterium]